jgi:hypothetical protein
MKIFGRLSLDQTEMFCGGVFVIAAVYALVNRQANTILGGIAFVLIMMGALPRQRALAFLVGASVTLLLQRRVEGFRVTTPDGRTLVLPHYMREGFQSGAAVVDKLKKKVDAEKVKAENFETEKEEAVETQEAKEEEEELASAEAFAGGKPMLPDNRERLEPLVLGKPYKLPSENDDKGFHLDAGTTFLNAYKALKPDQISAMTKDTQDLLATQKSLVSMLDSFAPLLKDMNKITGFFGQ